MKVRRIKTNTYRAILREAMYRYDWRGLTKLQKLREFFRSTRLAEMMRTGHWRRSED